MQSQLYVMKYHNGQQYNLPQSTSYLVGPPGQDMEALWREFESARVPFNHRFDRRTEQFVRWLAATKPEFQGFAQAEHTTIGF